MALTQVTGRGLGTQTTLAGSNTLVLDTDGIMTRPLQPAFFAYSDTAQSNIATNTVTTVAFGTQVFDNNGDWGSDTFTSPVTGRYQLQFSIVLRNLDSAADYYRLSLYTSNKNYDFFSDPNFDSSSPDYDSVFQFYSVPMLVDMDASDTAQVKVFQPNGTAQTDISASEAFFSGYLVC